MSIPLHSTRVLGSWFDAGDGNGIRGCVQCSGDLDLLTLELLGSVLIIQDVCGLAGAVLQHELSAGFRNLSCERLRVRHLMTHAVGLRLLLGRLATGIWRLLRISARLKQTQSNP